MKAKLLFLFLIFQTSFALTSDYSEVKIVGTRHPEVNGSLTYHRQLLELVLNKTAPTGVIRKTVPQGPMVPAREVKQLQLGKLDVIGSGTSVELENTLDAVRIPLFRGLLGYRVSLTHKDNLDRLYHINKREDLIKLLPCQASDWADTTILKHAGFSVVENTNYMGMFKQVNAKRCDIFPRAIYEARSEYELAKKIMPELRLYQDLIIHYPYPQYFFVKKGNEKLKNILTEGLEKAIDDGSLDQLLRTHQVTAHLFPLDKWKGARYIELDNPILPEGTNTTNPRYWINLKGE